MKHYKLRHAATGKYYRPYVGPRSSNLVQRGGKIYRSVPPVIESYRPHDGSDFVRTMPGDFIVEEYELKLVAERPMELPEDDPGADVRGTDYDPWKVTDNQ